MKRKLFVLAFGGALLVGAVFICSTRFGPNHSETQVVVMQDGKITVLPASLRGRPTIVWHASHKASNTMAQPKPPTEK